MRTPHAQLIQTKPHNPHTITWSYAQEGLTGSPRQTGPLSLSYARCVCERVCSVCVRARAYMCVCVSLYLHTFGSKPFTLHPHPKSPGHRCRARCNSEMCGGTSRPEPSQAACPSLLKHVSRCNLDPRALPRNSIVGNPTLAQRP